MTLQDEQAPLDRALCDAMVASTPETWNAIVLTLERFTGWPPGQLRYSLVNPEGLPPATPSDDVFEAGGHLDDLFARFGRRFTRATYRVDLFADSWKYAVDVDYGPTRNDPLQADVP